MRNYRRLILPIVMVLGTFICAYAAFFLGVKEDLPFPPGATRNALSTSQQTTVAYEWPDSTAWKSATAEVYILNDSLNNSLAYYREAFVTKRGWKEVTPAPGQPKDAAPGTTMSILSFTKDKTQVIVAITPAQPVLTVDTPLNRAIRASNIGEKDLLAIVLYGQYK